MSVTLTLKSYISVDGTTLKVKNTTAGYDVSANPGGWGAPNEEQNQQALFFIVIRKASTGDQYLTPVTVDVVFDENAISSDQQYVKFNYGGDGSHELYVGMLEVSTDNVNFLSGAAIQEGDIFYYEGDVVTRTNGENVETAITTLIGNEDILQAVVYEYLGADAAIKKQEFYKQYAQSRDTQCNDAEEKLWDLVKLREDLEGATYAFYSGLRVQAQSQAESMIDRYQLGV